MPQMNADQHGAPLFDTHPTVYEGDRVVEKAAQGPARAALRREASVLAQVDSPLVVRFVELREEDARTILVTRDAGSRTLARSAKLSLTEVRRSLIECIRAVKELHSMGWEHRAITPAHVIVGFRGRIKLCSMGLATRISPDRQMSVAPANPSEPPSDVVALIQLFSEVASQKHTETQWSERRRREKFMEALASAASSAAALVEAGHAPAEILDQLAQSLAPVRTGRTDLIGGSLRSKGPRRAVTAAAAVLIVTMGVLGASATRSAATSEAGGTTRTRHVNGVRLGSEEKYSSSSTPSSTASIKEPAGSSDQSLPERNIVVVDEKIFSVGEPGDVTVAAYWFCSEAKRLIMLRPSTGELFIFDSWAEEGKPSVARLITVDKGAVRLDSEHSTCDEPVIERADGSRWVIERQLLEGTQQ